MNSMLPSIQIDDDVIDLEETDNVPTTTWDEKIRTMLTKGMDGKVPLDDLLKLYSRSLRDQMRVSKDKTLLRDKIMTHLNYFHIHYMEINDILNMSSYYELIEDVLANYCSLELDLLRWKFPHRIKTKKKRYLPEVKGALNRICGVLTTFLNGREAHVVHVLLKMRYSKFSEVTTELRRLLHKRMLFDKPLSDSTDEELCRLWIVFQKVKEVVDPVHLHKTEKVFAAKYGAVELRRSSEAIRNVFYVDKNGSRVANLLHIKDRVVQNYFCYLNMKKMKEEEPFVDVGSHNLCDAFEEETLYEKVFGRNMHMRESPIVCTQNSDSADDVVILSDNEEECIPKKVDKQPKKHNVLVSGEVIDLESDDDEDIRMPSSQPSTNSLTSKFPMLNINDLTRPESSSSSVTVGKKTVTVNSDTPETVRIMDTQKSDAHDMVAVVDTDESTVENVTVTNTNSTNPQTVTAVDGENTCNTKTSSDKNDAETPMDTENTMLYHQQDMNQEKSTKPDKTDTIKVSKTSESEQHNSDINRSKVVVESSAIPENSKTARSSEAEGKSTEPIKINGLSLSQILVNAFVPEKTNDNSTVGKTKQNHTNPETLAKDIGLDVLNKATGSGKTTANNEQTSQQNETVGTSLPSSMASDITLKMMLDTLGVAIDANGSPNPVQEKIQGIKSQLESKILREKEAFNMLIEEIKGSLNKKTSDEIIEYGEVKEENVVDVDFSIKIKLDPDEEDKLLEGDDISDVQSNADVIGDVKRESGDLLRNLDNDVPAVESNVNSKFIKAPMQFQKKPTEVDQNDLMEVFSSNEDNLEGFLDDDGDNLDNLVGGLENILTEDPLNLDTEWSENHMKSFPDKANSGIIQCENVTTKNLLYQNTHIETILSGNQSQLGSDKHILENNYPQRSKLVNGMLTPNTSEGKAEEEHIYVGTNRQNAQESTDYEDSLYESYSDISTPDLKEKERRKGTDTVSILQTLKVMPRNNDHLHKKAIDVPLFRSCDKEMASVTLNDFNKQKKSGNNLKLVQTNNPDLDVFDEFQESFSGNLTKINGTGHHYNYDFFNCEKADNFPVNKVGNTGIVEDRWLKSDSHRADMGSKQSYRLSSPSSSPISSRSFDEIPKTNYLEHRNVVRKVKEPKGILTNEAQSYSLPVASLLFDLEEDEQVSYERQERGKRKMTDAKDKPGGTLLPKKRKITINEPIEKLNLQPKVKLEKYSTVDLIKLQLQTVNDKVLKNHFTKTSCILDRLPFEGRDRDVVTSPSRVPDPEKFLKENPVTGTVDYSKLVCYAESMSDIEASDSDSIDIPPIHVGSELSTPEKYFTSTDSCKDCSDFCNKGDLEICKNPAESDFLGFSSSSTFLIEPEQLQTCLDEKTSLEEDASENLVPKKVIFLSDNSNFYTNPNLSKVTNSLQNASNNINPKNNSIDTQNNTNKPEEILEERRNEDFIEEKKINEDHIEERRKEDYNHAEDENPIHAGRKDIIKQEELSAEVDNKLKNKENETFTSERQEDTKEIENEPNQIIENEFHEESYGKEETVQYMETDSNTKMEIVCTEREALSEVKSFNRNEENRDLDAEEFYDENVNCKKKTRGQDKKHKNRKNQKHTEKPNANKRKKKKTKTFIATNSNCLSVRNKIFSPKRENQDGEIFKDKNVPIIVENVIGSTENKEFIFENVETPVFHEQIKIHSNEYGPLIDSNTETLVCEQKVDDSIVNPNKGVIISNQTENIAYPEDEHEDKSNDSDREILVLDNEQKVDTEQEIVVTDIDREIMDSDCEQDNVVSDTKHTGILIAGTEQEIIVPISHERECNIKLIDNEHPIAVAVINREKDSVIKSNDILVESNEHMNTLCNLEHVKSDYNYPEGNVNKTGNDRYYEEETDYVNEIPEIDNEHIIEITVSGEDFCGDPTSNVELESIVPEEYYKVQINYDKNDTITTPNGDLDYENSEVIKTQMIDLNYESSPVTETKDVNLIYENTEVMDTRHYSDDDFNLEEFIKYNCNEDESTHLPFKKRRMSSTNTRSSFESDCENSDMEIETSLDTNNIISVSTLDNDGIALFPPTTSDTMTVFTSDCLTTNTGDATTLASDTVPVYTAVKSNAGLVNDIGNKSLLQTLSLVACSRELTETSDATTRPVCVGDNLLVKSSTEDLLTVPNIKLLQNYSITGQLGESWGIVKPQQNCSEVQQQTNIEMLKNDIKLQKISAKIKDATCVKSKPTLPVSINITDFISSEFDTLGSLVSSLELLKNKETTHRIDIPCSTDSMLHTQSQSLLEEHPTSINDRLLLPSCSRKTRNAPDSLKQTPCRKALQRNCSKSTFSHSYEPRITRSRSRSIQTSTNNFPASAPSQVTSQSTASFAPIVPSRSDKHQISTNSCTQTTASLIQTAPPRASLSSCKKIQTPANNSNIPSQIMLQTAASLIQTVPTRSSGEKHKSSSHIMAQTTPSLAQTRGTSGDIFTLLSPNNVSTAMQVCTSETLQLPICISDALPIYTSEIPVCTSVTSLICNTSDVPLINTSVNSLICNNSELPVNYPGVNPTIVCSNSDLPVMLGTGPLVCNSGTTLMHNSGTSLLCNTSDAGIVFGSEAPLICNNNDVTLMHANSASMVASDAGLLQASETVPFISNTNALQPSDNALNLTLTIKQKLPDENLAACSSSNKKRTESEEGDYHIDPDILKELNKYNFEDDAEIKMLLEALKHDKDEHLPFKKRKMSVSVKQAKEEICYPATPMISIAELEAIESNSRPQAKRPFKTPAELKEMPPLPPVFNCGGNVAPTTNPTYPTYLPIPPYLPCTPYYPLIPPLLLPFNGLPQLQQQPQATMSNAGYKSVKHNNRKKEKSSNENYCKYT